MSAYDISQYPYNFVPIDTTRTPDRQNPISHHKFTGVSGKLTLTVKAETPIFIRHKTQEVQRDPKGDAIPYEFAHKTVRTQEGRESRQYFIPGTSFKGMLRSVAEAIANSCISVFSREYKDGRYCAPNGFEKCSEANSLCITCRLFGMQSNNGVFMGKVNVGDLDCSRALEMGEVIMPILGEPKPRHRSFYGTQNNHSIIAGRKFYFHRPQGIIRENRIHRTRQNFMQNSKVRPLDKGSVFTGEVFFENLTDEELKLLIYSLVLEDNMRHKIGMGKPAGYGSIKIEVTRVELLDFGKRYSANPEEASNWRRALEGRDLSSWKQEQTSAFSALRNINIQCLRKIWKWDPKNTIDYRYPPQSWFRAPENINRRLHRLI